ncbi:nucleoside triphosphate pyrophosphohydrolase [Methyloceanibacter sp.]|uniref:nucleoside triphosphate pyrophosphohydrolase n=1 Tax=Methyloceanibacter sp. TaxID=1965321 RepID=UPI002D4FBBE4|nr:nucleoside triphosphate pyrophosphohydrolase [Methyloceanibacter sp.]HZP07999.1 nucleoside triphosphate pyrophosphohydrolase [Methyloceanibacter sp.]
MADKASEKRYSLDDLIAVMARLRDPENGCPWDVKQDFATIAPYTIEEAYEVADAIARDDMDALKDELGDLLLQVVYHAQMASEESRFDFADVADAITRKMIRRHPHVFADASLRDEFVSSNLWERIKAEEKARRGAAGGMLSARLDDVALALPALTRAVKLQKRAAEVGFDWPSLKPVLDKVDEEIAELKEAIGARDDAARVREEFGDLLFVMANVARHLKIDPEAALRDANTKFVRRLRGIEEALAKEGRTCEEATLEEMDRLWDEAKEAERKA